MYHSSEGEIDSVKEMQDKCKLQISNNNEEEFENGRVSGGSHESAFTDSDETHSQLDLSTDNNNSFSGRSSSSANRDSTADHSLEDVKLLNSHCNLAPEMNEILALVDNVRTRFLACLKEEDNADLFDNSDIMEITKPLLPANKQEQSLTFRLISRFLNFKKILANNSKERTEHDINGAVESLKELLKFRQHYQLSKTLPEHFSKEFFILSGIFQFGHDKQHVPVLYIRARVHRRWSPGFDESFRRYVAWQIDCLTKSYHEASVSKTIGYTGLEKDGSFGICFDCLNVSYSCLDMDFLKFLVRILVNYYPSYCRYALCVDLPWLFRSVWKLVRSWLPEEAQNTVQLITSKELVDYIDEDQIPNSMRINDLEASEKKIRGKHQFPKNWNSIRGIDELAKELKLTPNEVRQFKTHVEKVRKEYEQLGAL